MSEEESQSSILDLPEEKTDDSPDFSQDENSVSQWSERSLGSIGKRGRSEKEDDKSDSNGPDCKRVRTSSEDELSQDSTTVLNDDKSETGMEDGADSPVLNLSKKSSENQKKDEKNEKDSQGGESDKENLDAPMDLSKGGSKGDDVIMLSDGEEDPRKGMVNGFGEGHISGKDAVSLLKRLKDELRNEEAKLVLLKKIRQSQIMQHMQAESGTKGSPGQAAPRGTSSQPPPLVRTGSQHMSGSHKPTQSVPPQMQRAPGQQVPGQRPHQSSKGGPPPLIMAPRQHSTPISGQRSSGSSSSQRPGQNSSNMVNNYQRQQSGTPTQHSTPQPPAQPEQTPAQRQAAAKLALRKQLEKTLLQIPPPKPPAPEMNFIPSLAGAEFMMLVGLEEVVKSIVEYDKNKENKAPEVKYVFNPFVCVQCGTDFTPVWKRDKPGSKNVICEQCVTSNQKKALKQEHTNRLKSAFVKALQQEQEIEQRMQSTSSTTSSSTSSAPSASNSNHAHSGHGHHSSSHHRERSSDSTHSSSHQSTHSSSAPMNLSKVTSEQLRQHQNLLQAHQAQLRSPAHLAAAASMGFNPRLMYPFQPPVTMASAAKNVSELQRQYLLDMIPRSLPGSNVLWRS